jgi:hypothetical protein
MDIEEREPEDYEIERGETGLRILYTVLFFAIARVTESVLFTVVIFELLWTLITKQPPSVGVRNFANRALAYYYRIGRYLTYNEPRAPFPFAEFPDEVHPVLPEYIEDDARD